MLQQTRTINRPDGPGIRRPITARANVALMSIPSLCARAQTLLAEIRATSKDMRARHDRAKAKLGAAPREIAIRILRTSPDFDCIDRKTRNANVGDAIPSWIIEAAINDVEGAKWCEVTERTPEFTTIRTFNKLQTRTMTDDEKARATRLRNMLKIANERAAAWKAALAEAGYTDDDGSSKLSDQVDRLVVKIAAMRSKSATDLLAKLALLNLEPDWFSSARPGEIGLADSIFRDVPNLLEPPALTKLGGRPDRIATAS